MDVLTFRNVCLDYEDHRNSRVLRRPLILHQSHCEDRLERRRKIITCSPRDGTYIGRRATVVVFNTVSSKASHALPLTLGIAARALEKTVRT